MTVCGNDFSLSVSANCRRFDFTLGFEHVVLIGIPSIIVTILALVNIRELLKHERCLKEFKDWPLFAKTVAVGKLLSGVGLLATTIASLAFWSTDGQINSWTSKFAQSLSPVAAISVCAWLFLQHYRSVSNNVLATVYLFSNIFVSATLIRTYALAGILQRGIGITAILELVFRSLLLVLDNQTKASICERGDSGKALPIQATATAFSRLFFVWLDPLMWRGFRQPLTMSTLGDLDPRLASDVLYERAEANWRKFSGSGKSRPLMRTIIATFGFDLAKPIIPCLVYTLTQIAQPLLIREVLTFLSSFENGGVNSEPDEWGWGLGAAYFLVFSLYAVAYAQFYLLVNLNMAMIRGFLIEAIYRKALVVHIQVANEVGSGAATSLMSIDAERIAKQVLAIHQMYSAAILVALGFVIVHNVVGIIFVGTLVAALLCLFAIPLASHGLSNLQGRLSALTDKRIRLMASVLNGIKQIKLSAYEDAILSKVSILRSAEMKEMRWYWFRLLCVSAITNLLSNAMTAATIIFYFIRGQAGSIDFNVTKLFTVLSVISILSTPLLMVGQNWSQILTALASLKRIEAFLLRKERQSPLENGDSPESIAAMQQATLSYDGEAVLNNLTVAIPTNKLTIVIGEVGSGKSTLLNALLGEVDIQSKCHVLPDALRIGSATQESWLQPDQSIRDNITFHEEFDIDWYREVISACALEQGGRFGETFYKTYATDFQLMDKGDRRKAQGLSGGQAQRVCLARAIYSKAEVYILDDCFSALDATTEAHVFTTLFGFEGLLSGKTVILATNGIHRLQYADLIITIGNGTILESGSYHELTNLNAYTKNLVDRFGSGVAKSNAQKKDSATKVAAAAGASLASSEPEDLIALEMASQFWKGNPSLAFTKAVGYALSLPAFAFYIASFTLVGMTSLYVEIWVSGSPLSYAYFGGYLGLELLYVACFGSAILFMFIIWAQRGAKALHRGLLKSVMSTDMAFFDRTPVGVILNRFSEDTNSVDQVYPNHFANTLSCGTFCVTSLVLMFIASYYTIPVIIAALASCVLCQRFYIRSSRELRKLSLASKSPLYSTFAATINPAGLQVIRSFKAGTYLAQMNTEHATTSQNPTYLMNVVKRWLSLVLDLNVAAINTALCFLAVAQRHSGNGAIFAVALQQGITLTTWLNVTITAFSELEVEEASISRIMQFSNLPKEEDTPSNQTADSEKEKETPKIGMEMMENHNFGAGRIEFTKVTLRYDKAETAALKSLSLKIESGQRIGFVGRTGSGKSTTLAALLRMHEIDNDGGDITVDGKSIKSISRHSLRSQISIIPQDPLLLDMTLRDNLDLYNQHTDEAIWAALDQCKAKVFVQALEGKLDFAVSGSAAFSRGQRQLLALARTVLNPRRIICLDEATSSLDMATDYEIQQTIRRAFSSSTILCVAHRTHTVLDYDIVCVLDAGRVVECGSPGMLLQDTSSRFSRLAREQGAAV